MSLTDFCSLTLPEWQKVYSSWKEEKEAAIKDEWERTRILATLCLQPHVKRGKKLKPSNILRLPWDNKSYETKEETREEAFAQFEAFAKKCGIK